MAVSSKHPDYNDHADEWVLLRDCDRGENAIKRAAEVYLPKPSGFTLQPDGGVRAYTSYQLRAQFPDILAPTLRGMVGLVHSEEAQIEMPDAMLPIWERATREGLPLEALHRRLTSEVLLMGRYGLLVDAPMDGADMPYIAPYVAETIINFDYDGSFFVLDETAPVRKDNGFEWEEVKRYRVLRRDPETGVYSQQIYNDETAGAIITPTGRGASALTGIPFVTVGARDISVGIDDSPLIGVARAACAIYRLDADYRLQLYQTGQETLFISGIDKEAIPPVTGATATIAIPEGAKAEYVGPRGIGIESHRTAIMDERDRAIAAGSRVFDGKKSGTESGEALRIRFAAQNATLRTVALSSAAGLEKALRYVAQFMGLDPNTVIVKPNLDFVGAELSSLDVLNLVKAWQGGAFSYQTLYENLQRGGIASEERDSDEEKALLEEDAPMLETPELDDNNDPDLRKPVEE